MWTLLDTIGASIIGASIIFMVLALNLQMNNVSSQITENNLIQSYYTASMDILEYDIYKMGYNIMDIREDNDKKGLYHVHIKKEDK